LINRSGTDAAEPDLSRSVVILWTWLTVTGLSWETPFEMRALLVLLCLILTACSTPEDLPPIKTYVPPSMPSTAAVTKGIATAAGEEKVTAPIEMSELHETDHGPGRFYLCVRGRDSASSPIRYYAVFFDNDDYTGVRLSVILEDCEKQAFRPYVGAIAAPPATPPSPTPAPVGHHHRNHQPPS
jgi:hypothetical protein